MTRNKTGMPWADYLNAKGSQHKRGLPKSHGIRCPHCYGIHPYTGLHQLGFGYRYSDNRLTIIWTCPVTGDVLENQDYTAID